MICFDANVLLEIVLERSHAGECQKYLDNTTQDAAITALTAHLIMYFAERHKLNLEAAERLLELFVWLPLNEADIRWAIEHYKGDDFEDALQVASALREGAKKFVTLDQKLARKYKEDLPIKLLK